MADGVVAAGFDAADVAAVADRFAAVVMLGSFGCGRESDDDGVAANDAILSGLDAVAVAAAAAAADHQVHFVDGSLHAADDDDGAVDAFVSWTTVADVAAATRHCLGCANDDVAVVVAAVVAISLSLG